ncbi:MAG TPA: hypothetical protein VF172_00930 [Nitrososphaera sp.]|jgi:hypothetical protein
MPDRLSRLKLLVVAAGVTAIVGLVAYNSSVFASHSFELGVSGNSVPDNTHIRLDGLTLPPGGVLPVYDASPNFVSGHFLMRAPCDDNHVPMVTVIGGHIDESAHGTFVDKLPLYYISHASGPDSCVYHAHVPDPLNGGAPRVTDIALVNLSGEELSFNPGDMVDINVQSVLGSIGDSPYEEMQLPADITHGNPVYDLNDDNPENDGLGFEHHGGEEE